MGLRERWAGGEGAAVGEPEAGAAPEAPGPLTQGAGVRVEAVKLNKRFGENRVLRDLDLEVRAGETFVIIGGSGCGKSVLLKHIAGLLVPDSGRILVDGRDLHGPGVRDGFRTAIVFQSGALFSSLTVGENVGLWLKEHRICPPEEIIGVVAEKLDLVGLAGKDGLMPSELSGGMRKRVAIARALAMAPNLILYDEPTAELDPVMTAHMAEVIVDLKRRFRITAMVVTHDMHFGGLVADRMGMLAEGRIVEVGTPAEIRRSQNPAVQAFLTATAKGPGGGA